jgi:thymidine phosphorylase
LAAQNIESSRSIQNLLEVTKHAQHDQKEKKREIIKKEKATQNFDAFYDGEQYSLIIKKMKPQVSKHEGEMQIEDYDI